MEGESMSVDRESVETTDRAKLYEEVPDGIPRFVVRRLDDETLIRLAEGEPLNWTKRV